MITDLDWASLTILFPLLMVAGDGEDSLFLENDNIPLRSLTFFIPRLYEHVYNAHTHMCTHTETHKDALHTDAHTQMCACMHTHRRTKHRHTDTRTHTQTH